MTMNQKPHNPGKWFKLTPKEGAVPTQEEITVHAITPMLQGGRFGDSYVSLIAYTMQGIGLTTTIVRKGRADDGCEIVFQPA
jgi:hypothetical protein